LSLSAVVQGVGYVIAGFGVLACGWLHTRAGTWQLPLLLVLAILLGQVISGHVSVSHRATVIPFRLRARQIIPEVPLLPPRDIPEVGA
jgi:CP family cyanate transporter-like MFS transporter